MKKIFSKFNISKFLSYEIIFKDNKLLSNIKDNIIEIKNTNIDINKKITLPIHIIYIGDILKDNNINININIDNQEVFLTLKLINKLKNNLNININNNGKNSKFKGKIIIKNESILDIKENCNHLNKNTEIILYTRIINLKNSNSRISAVANIEKNLKECISDINFSAIAEINSKIDFLPVQYIKSIPISADHSASLYKENQKQIEYLKNSGLNKNKINKILKEAFIKDIEIF